MGVMNDLFAGLEGEQSIEQLHCTLPPHERAIAALERVLHAAHPCVLQFSSGKDSSACANLLFTAGRNVMARGQTCPPLYVCHVDTGVENPVVRALADAELKKMRDFARLHQLPLAIHVGRPTLSASYATRVIGGRALPPFPQTTRDCTVNFKIDSSQRIHRRLAQQNAQAAKPIVTIIGTRSAESQARQIATAERNESAHELWYGPTGDARLSPILDWENDEVWEYIGGCAAGEHLAYSDFSDLMEFYADAGASSCVVVADMRSAANNKACGARGGCYICTAVQNDRSVENMIEANPGRYPYLVPLLEFRDFVANTQWDWRLRNFVGRTIDEDGYILARADQYSPAMCEDLLRYLLAAQDRANALGAPAHVQAVGLRELIAIDWYWSVRAWHPPFHALWVYFDHCAGNTRSAPKISAPCPPTPPPDLGKIYVGDAWDCDAHPMRPPGLRDPAWEMFSESCGPSLRSSPAGKVFLSIEETPQFDVDEEGAALFLEFEAERMLAEHHRQDTDWTSAASIYVRYGTVTMAKGQSSTVDDMIRRSQWLQRHDLHGHRTAEDLANRCAIPAKGQRSLFA